MEIRHRWSGALAALAGSALMTTACVTRALPDSRTTAAASAVSVACEPSQRAIVRPVTSNGVTSSQVECVSVPGATSPGAAMMAGVQPVAYTPAPADTASPVYAYVRPAVYQTPAPMTAVAPMTAAAPAAEPVRMASTPARTVHYERRPVRSRKKSALIIGSSAGAAAGLGAVIGGKKGALVGAVLGGGGATLWDQITRRKQ